MYGQPLDCLHNWQLRNATTQNQKNGPTQYHLRCKFDSKARMGMMKILLSVCHWLLRNAASQNEEKLNDTIHLVENPQSKSDAKIRSVDDKDTFAWGRWTNKGWQLPCLHKWLRWPRWQEICFHHRCALNKGHWEDFSSQETEGDRGQWSPNSIVCQHTSATQYIAEHC